MAYINQETKAQIVKEVKKLLPKGWKASYAIKDHSNLIMTISQAPVDVYGAIVTDSYGYDMGARTLDEGYRTLYLGTGTLSKDQFNCEEIGDIMEKVSAALQAHNYNKSQVEYDHHDVGYYTRINIGTFNKRFVCAG